MTGQPRTHIRFHFSPKMLPRAAVSCPVCSMTRIYFIGAYREEMVGCACDAAREHLATHAEQA